MLKTENPETATDNKTEKPKLTQKNGKNRKTENPNAPLLYVCIRYPMMRAMNAVAK